MREQNGIKIWFMLGLGFMAFINLPFSVSQSLKAFTREGLSPLNALVSGVSYRVTNTIKTLQGWEGLIEENRALSGENVLLKTQVAELENLHRENIELRKQLEFLGTSEKKLIPCEVISRDISGWWQTIRLNKGLQDGLEENYAVMTAKGLIGKVSDVSLRTADVLLISDPNCKVSVYMPRTYGYGILRGKGLSLKGEILCQVDFMSKNLDFLEKDLLQTSGLGGVFPRGIHVGRMERIYRDDSGLFQYADVVPAQDLGSLHYVFVVAEQHPVDRMLERRGTSVEAP